MFKLWRRGLIVKLYHRKCLLGCFSIIVILLQLLDILPSYIQYSPVINEDQETMYHFNNQVNNFNTNVTTSEYKPSDSDRDAHSLFHPSSSSSSLHHSRHIQGFYRTAIISTVDSDGPQHLDEDNDNNRSNLLTNKTSTVNSFQKQIINTNNTPSTIITSNLIKPIHIDWNTQAKIHFYEIHSKSKREIKELEEDGFVQFSYNVTASDQIPVNRKIPNTIPSSCPAADSVDELLNHTVSIVIAVHNEATSVLIRTLTSVLTNTHPKLLQELIVVFDNESDTYFVEDYFKDNSIIQFIHTRKREGLVRSRLLGAERATSSVLVFLDSHCECNVRWLEPLLLSIAQDKTKIVSPYIDSIRPDTFEYVETPANLQGSFNWHLDFVWQPIPFGTFKQRISPHEGIRTPTISGGLFAVNRNYFNQIGSYDHHMDIWGGENIELSFRTWMCGGQLEIVPCSRVGHVFRNILPHSFPNGGQETVKRNLVRVAETWMDDYKNIFYSILNLNKESYVEDVKERVQLRKKLKCKSFQWYLDNIVPDLIIPELHSLVFGQFRHQVSLLCLTIQSSRLHLETCNNQNINQILSLTSRGDIRLNNQTGNICVVGKRELRQGSCDNHIWKLQGNEINLSGTSLCLGSNDQETVDLVTCDLRPQTTWKMTYKLNKPWNSRARRRM